MSACSFRKPLAVPRLGLLAAMSLALLARPALGQTPPVQTCQLGNLALERGEVISNFRMTYITFGTLLILPNCQDQLHPPREGAVLEAAQHIPNAKLVDLDDTGGHRGSRSARSLATFDTEVKDLLKRVAEGRPGISGPRFPKNWSRNDFCPG